jgi:hypothetical protein
VSGTSPSLGSASSKTLSRNAHTSATPSALASVSVMKGYRMGGAAHSAARRWKASTCMSSGAELPTSGLVLQVAALLKADADDGNTIAWSIARHSATPGTVTVRAAHPC